MNFQDKTWESINKTLDKYFYEELKKSLSKSLWQINNFTNLEWINIDNLSDIEKNKLYTELLASYQNLKPSSIFPSDNKLFKTKLKYQSILAKIAPENEKESILRTLVYDLKESIDLKNIDDFKSIIKLLWENKDFIDLNNLNKFLDASWLDDSFKKSIDNLIWNFDIEKLNEFVNWGFNWLGDVVKKTVNDLQDKIKNIGENINLNKIPNFWD